MRMNTTMKRNLLWGLVLSVAALAVSFAVWGAVPSPMPIHWDAAGNPNGFASRAVGLTAMPITGALMALVLAAFGGALADKPKAQRALGHVIVAMAAFLVALHLLVIRAALTGGTLAVGALVVLMGALFVALGAMMQGLEQNRWVGVRTPWTLVDETNWVLTHRLAAWTMGIGGAIAMIVGLIFSGAVAFWLAFAAIMIGALLPVFGSWVIHASRGR
jgi:uncharacterized membrane protein